MNQTNQPSVPIMLDKRTFIVNEASSTVADIS